MGMYVAVPVIAALGGGAIALHRNGTIGDLGRLFNAANSTKKFTDFSEWMDAGEMRRRARTVLNMDIENDINIGFCGPVKSGKSRLVNALRGVSARDAQGPDWTTTVVNFFRRAKTKDVEEGRVEWAKEGVTETTTEIRPYRYPRRLGQDYSRIVLWDIPGSGTVSVPADTYFKDNLLFAFDILILLIKDTLREEDVKFANMASEYGVPWTFVRSFCDRDLRNEFTDLTDIGFCDFAQDNCIAEFKQNLIKKVRDLLKENGHRLDLNNGLAAERPCFCVGARYFETKVTLWKFEEDDLEAFIYEQVVARCKLLDGHNSNAN